MKKSLVLLLLIAIALPAAGEIYIEDMDANFRKHAVLGGGLMGIGFRVADVFLNETTERHWVDGNGVHHFELRIEERAQEPNHFLYRALTGLALNTLFIVATRQEAEDQNAMYCGATMWVFGELSYRAIKLHVWR